jgi:hypothetical protein
MTSYASILNKVQLKQKMATKKASEKSPFNRKREQFFSLEKAKRVKSG